MNAFYENKSSAQCHTELKKLTDSVLTCVDVKLFIKSKEKKRNDSRVLKKIKNLHPSRQFAEESALYCPGNITHLAVERKIKEHLLHITLIVLDCSLRPLRVLIALSASLGLTKLTKP